MFIAPLKPWSDTVPGSSDNVVLKYCELLDEFIRFLAHQTTVDRPAPGLGLTYAETIGTLYLIKEEGGLEIEFRAAQDRVLAAIARYQEEVTAGPRPEFEKREEDQDPDFDLIRPAPAGIGAPSGGGDFQLDAVQAPELDRSGR